MRRFARLAGLKVFISQELLLQMGTWCAGDNLNHLIAHLSVVSNKHSLWNLSGDDAVLL